MRSIFDFKPQFKRINLDPFSGDFNLNVTEGDMRTGDAALVGFALGGFYGGIAAGVAHATGIYDITDPFGTQAAMRQQQNMVNEYQTQQERMMREEQNRRWQGEIASSWAAYGAQRRSQISSGATSGSTLGPQSATEIYLGGR
jgi:hypothetical protein